MSLFAVMVRALGMLIGCFVIAHVVVVGCLKMVVSGSRMVGGSLVMVLGCGVLG